MRASISYLVLAGLASLAQASPIADPDPMTDPRGLITRSLSHVLPSRSWASGSETLPVKRQATAPAPPQSSGTGGGVINNATRNVTLVVEKGDTLGQIARLLNSGICQIAKLNSIANPDFIEVGQMLQVTINIANPDNDSCLNRGGAIPPATNSTGSGGAPPAPPAAAPASA